MKSKSLFPLINLAHRKHLKLLHGNRILALRVHLNSLFNILHFQIPHALMRPKKELNQIARGHLAIVRNRLILAHAQPVPFGKVHVIVTLLLEVFIGPE